jgi:hypothetical protein
MQERDGLGKSKEVPTFVKVSVSIHNYPIRSVFPVIPVFNSFKSGEVNYLN